MGNAKGILAPFGLVQSLSGFRCDRLHKECVLQTPARRTYRPRGPKGATAHSPALSGSSDSPLIVSRPCEKPRITATVFSDPTAFLGSTSFSAVLNESRGNHDIDRLSSHPEPEDFSDIYPDALARGIEVLSQIPDEKTCKTLFSRHTNPNDGWVRLAGTKVSDSMFAHFADTFESRNQAKLSSMATLICRNTANALKEGSDSASWLASFTGGNLRWESIGILFTYWAFGAISSPESDLMFSQAPRGKLERKTYMMQMKACASSCIALCSHVDRGNPLLVYLLYKHLLLESIVSGDSSKYLNSGEKTCLIIQGLICWRQLGDLVSVATALGLHRDSDSGPITVASEVRRRVYAAVFNIDKVFATFLGRPPLISGRYNSTPLPLDLSDEALLGKEESFREAIEALDPRGWNTDNQIYSTTILRARTVFNFIRDEILALALGSQGENLANSVEYGDISPPSLITDLL